MGRRPAARSAQWLVLLMACACPVRAADVLWLETEDYRSAEGEVLLIDETTADYGGMATAEASGGRFVRFPPGVEMTLQPASTEQPREWQVWVRAFPLPGRPSLADRGLRREPEGCRTWGGRA